MFAKKASFKQFSAIKGSERKTLLSKIDAQFRVDPDQEKNSLVPKSIQTAKAVLHSGAKAQVYTDGSVPLWIIAEDKLIPSVVMAHRLPGLLPVVYTVPNTLKFLRNGADFMIPGIFGDLPEVNKGEAVQIRSLDGQIIAVGFSRVDFAQLGKTGKAITVVNVWGDTLVPESAITQKISTESLNSTAETVNDRPSDESVDPQARKDDDRAATEIRDHPEDPPLLTNEVDDAFIYALDRSLTLSWELPLPLATFAPSLQSNLPYEHDGLLIKNSQWKKLASFMKSAEKEGKLKLKDRHGELVIQSISDTAKTAVEAPPPARSVGSKQNKEPKVDKMEAHQYYRPRSTTSEVLGDHDVGGYYSAKELTSIIGEYIRSHNLGSGSTVKIDDGLRRALGLKQDVSDLGRADVIPLFLKNTNVFHTISFPGQDQQPKMAKGVIPQISVAAEKRGGNKVVTVVSGLEAFGFDLKATAELFRHKCAGSSSISETRTGNQVLVQGNHVPKIVSALEAKGVRQAWIKA